MTSKVFLIGAGPGDPDLLTIKAAHLLARADVVLYDALVSREVLGLVNPLAELVDVGKRAGRKLLTQEEINSLLISYAKSQGSVVRLKGGDPLIFGRAGEEIQALRGAKIEFEIVPGITAALGAAAAAGISLTDRRVASQVLFTTFSRGSAANSMDWSTVNSATTLAIYMPGPDYAEVSRWLQDGGLPGALPCALVSRATTPEQHICWTNVAALAMEPRRAAPALLIVGRVATLHARELAEQFWRDISASRENRVTMLGDRSMRGS